MKDRMPSGRRVSRRRFMTAAGMTLAGLHRAIPSPIPAGSAQQLSSVVEAVVLGSSQDGGVPHAGCPCTHCEAARKNPALRRRSPALALLHHGEKKAFMIDAGPDFPSQLDDLPREWRTPRLPLAGIVLSHAHIGHYVGLSHLGREVLGAGGVPVWCSDRMADFLRRNGPWSLLVELGNIELRVIEAGKAFSPCAGLTIEPISVPHRAEFTDTLFFTVAGPNRRLLYLTDVDRWEGLNPPIEELAASAQIALLDGTFYSAEELPGRDMSTIPHPSVTETMNRLGKLAETSETRIIFTHLNHSNLLLDADGEKLRDLRERGFEIACDGMRFEL